MLACVRGRGKAGDGHASDVFTRSAVNSSELDPRLSLPVLRCPILVPCFVRSSHCPAGSLGTLASSRILCSSVLNSDLSYHAASPRCCPQWPPYSCHRLQCLGMTWPGGTGSHLFPGFPHASYSGCQTPTSFVAPPAVLNLPLLTRWSVWGTLLFRCRSVALSFNSMNPLLFHSKKWKLGDKRWLSLWFWSETMVLTQPAVLLVFLFLAYVVLGPHMMVIPPHFLIRM